jgi:hypothetical protein
VLRPAGQRPGDGAFSGAEIQDRARLIGDEPFQEVEHLRRVRRPVLVGVRDARMGEGLGQLAARGAG